MGLQCFNEMRQSLGFARQCGLEHAKRKYHCIDADTFYSPKYIDMMMDKLSPSGVSFISSFWSFIQNDKHSSFGLFLFELVRDAFLYLQHFKRSELCARGMVFAFKTDLARKVTIRADVLRGKDCSLALSLKPYGKISFLYNRQTRPDTGNDTKVSQSLLQSFIHHVKIRGKGISRIFLKKEYYEYSEVKLVKSIQ